MRAGNLKHKVTIQSIGTTTNSFGEIEQGDFQTFKIVWCSINPIRGSEKFLSNTDFAKTTHKIRIRYLAEVNASMRILWGSRVFNFIDVRNAMESDKELEILAEEAING